MPIYCVVHGCKSKQKSAGDKKEEQPTFFHGSELNYYCEKYMFMYCVDRKTENRVKREKTDLTLAQG